MINAMATSSESMSSRPSDGTDASSKYYSEGEYKENGSRGRNELSIPTPTTGRIHGAPLSPVRVHVSSDGWPQASVAVIEDGHARGDSQSTMMSGHSGSDSSGPTISKISAMPHRPSPNTDLRRAQVMRPSSRTSSRSGSSSTGSSHPSSNRYPDPIDENEPSTTPVPRLQYHHQSHYSDSSDNQPPRRAFIQSPGTPDIAEIGQSINRHLTPNSQYAMRNSIPRPPSAYSDMGPRGRSPGVSGSPHWGQRAPSAHSGRSDVRPMSFIDLANVSYPQAPPPPISLDNSQLRSAVGTNASLLSMGKTLEMYRQNVKKLNDPETQYAFAIFLIQAAQDAGLDVGDPNTKRKTSPKPGGRDLDNPYVENQQATPYELLTEARHILQKLADRSYPFAQYYLADGYASGLFSKGKEDYNTAFPLFIAASKRGHAESGYRAALCYEFGWGCRKDPAKAVQFYRQSASKNHPGAMTRLGRACMSGDLGLNKYREGLKWLKRATESADLQYNQAPYHLANMYETGYGDDIFKDEAYAAQLFTQAADLGHMEACYRLGDAYEHGKLSCPRDPALSVHFYTGAAQQGHPMAMMALCAWYMVGAPPVLEKDENEAYEWARQAAETGLTKAEYAVGYFTEMGIGCRRDVLEANVWYVKAAESGDERAKLRLAAIQAAAAGGTPMEVANPKIGKGKKFGSGIDKTDKDCIVM